MPVSRSPKFFMVAAFVTTSFFALVLCFLLPQNGMHTLCLLDIKVKEPDFEKMARGKVAYLPPRYMTVSERAMHASTL